MFGTVKVIKIEVEDEENKVQKLALTTISAVILTLASQWLFGKCRHWKRPSTTGDGSSELHRESSEEFEMVENEDETEQVQTQLTEEPQNEGPVEMTSSPTRPNAILSQETEGRKLYGTKFGDKYHFKPTCKGFNDYPNFEKKPCVSCQTRITRIIDLAEGPRADISETILGFEVNGENYHDEECTVYKIQRNGKDRKVMCRICSKEEAAVQWARNRQTAGVESLRGRIA